MTLLFASGSEGDLFDSSTDNGQRALADLRDLLLNIGFRVHKGSGKEGTLRVYLPLPHKYPLLNPCFVEADQDGPDNPPADCLVFNVYSKGDAELDRRLASFQSNQECEFVRAEDDAKTGAYRVHGSFFLPLRFIERPDDTLLDLDANRESLIRVFRSLA